MIGGNVTVPVLVRWFARDDGRRRSSALFALACAVALTGCSTTAAVSKPGFGFDTAGMDRSVAPGDDFHRYANGAWLALTEIPPDQSVYGTMSRLKDLSTDRSRVILEEAARDPASKLGRAYRSFLDEDTVERKGLSPILPWLDRIRSLEAKSGYAALLAQAGRDGIPTIFEAGVKQDDKDPESNVLVLSQAGLGMPDRDYYLLDTPRMKTVREAYLGHVARMLALAGERNAVARADRLLAFETRIAQLHWTRANSRDRTRTYNRMGAAKLAAMAPGFDFAAWLDGLGAGKAGDLLVAQPDAVTGIAALVASADLSTLKDQLLVQSLDRYAAVLPKSFVEENFTFFGTALSGTPQIEPRWKRAVGFVDASLGQELGKHYVARYFPHATKAKIDELVANLRAAC